MNFSIFKAFLQNITTQRDTALVKFPEPEDLTGAAAALLRLQDTYQLSTHEIAEGRIQGVKRADDMTGMEFFQKMLKFSFLKDEIF